MTESYQHPANNVVVEGHPLELPVRVSEAIQPQVPSLLEMWKEVSVKDATTALQMLRCLGPPKWARLYGITDADLWMVLCAPHIAEEFSVGGTNSLLALWAQRYRPQEPPAAVVSRLTENFERRPMPELLDGAQLVEGM